MYMYSTYTYLYMYAYVVSLRSRLTEDEYEIRWNNTETHEHTVWPSLSTHDQVLIL
jgi:hypothetical protein